MPEIIMDIYENSGLMAADETNLDESAFPVECEWKSEQIVNCDFFPIVV